MPIPTNRPATTTSTTLASIRGAGNRLLAPGSSHDIANGAAMVPNKKEMRQPLSPLRGGSKPPRMPLMPKMRPFNKMNMAEAIPSRTPPASAVQGVKWIQSMAMTYSSYQAVKD